MPKRRVRYFVAFVFGLAIYFGFCVSDFGFQRWAQGTLIESAQASADDAPEEDPLGPNGACYVCHTTFVKEELAKTHLAQKVGCVKCHGLSAKHANDEDIGATKPDVIYPRDKVDAGCRECHDQHNAPARKVVERFIERKLPPKSTAICTDCHGTHKIERSAENKQ
jgi:predicted CXXCH cytochrome family protein